MAIAWSLRKELGFMEKSANLCRWHIFPMCLPRGYARLAVLIIEHFARNIRIRRCRLDWMEGDPSKVLPIPSKEFVF